MVEHVDVAVIGAGPGGYVAAIRAAQLGLKTACIEKRLELGGTCLNVGCIPSKALLHSSEIYWKLIQEAKHHGLEIPEININFKQMMDRKQGIIRSFNEGIASLFKKNKVIRYAGRAQLESPNQIAIQSGPSKIQVQARHIILATGSEPVPLPFLPFDEQRILSSTGALALRNIPKKLVVIGAGIIGVELGSVYSRLGTEVVFVEFLDRICPTLDLSLSKELKECLTRQGMQFHLNSKVFSAEIGEKLITLTIQKMDQSTELIHSNAVLVSIGRKPLSSHLGLENIGIMPTAQGFIPINGEFRTIIPHIFAIGDIVDGPMLAHKASEEGTAVAEIIAGHHPSIDYTTIPNVIYTYPEVASVGMTEEEANHFGFNPISGIFPFKANSRARCTGDQEGFVKILTDPKTDRLLGVHIIGAHASELIGEAGLAIRQKAKSLDIADLPHAHPTLSEALKEAALAVHHRAIHK